VSPVHSPDSDPDPKNGPGQSPEKTAEQLQSLEWVQRVVIGLNLCPFASGVVKSGNVQVHTEPSPEMATVLATCIQLCGKLVDAEAEHHANAETHDGHSEQGQPTKTYADRATALLILPNGFDEFDDFLDLVELCNALLVDQGYEGVLQIASFHPHYQFSGCESDDAANYSNRSPYPMLHLLQEAAVEQAVQQHPDPAGIPQRNIDQLRTMGVSEIKRLLNE